MFVCVVEPMGALHEHHQPLQSLGVDAVDLHGVFLQGVLVLEPLLAEGAVHDTLLPLLHLFGRLLRFFVRLFVLLGLLFLFLLV